MPPNHLKAVLFDWDGTLVDSARASFRCYVRLFARFGLTFDEGAFHRFYSPNWQRTYRAMGLPEARWAEADRLWLDLYSQDESHLMPGAREALQDVTARGLVLGLVTSGDGRRVRGELTRFGIADRFEVVLCGEDAQNRKPHPEALLLALETLAVQAGQAAYVGDSPEDVEMARAAGVYSVGVPGGFPNQEALRASDPDLWLTSIAELAERLPRPR